MAIGFIVRRSGKWADDFFQGLSVLVVRVALPAYFVVRVGRTDLSEFRSLLIMPALAVFVVAVGILLSMGMFSLLRISGRDRRAGMAMATFGNSGYMPLVMVEIVPLSVPVIAERFGGQAPVLIAAYVFLFSPILWSLGNYIITRHPGTDGGLRLRDLISPPLIGILVGLLVALTGIVRLLDDPGLPFRPVFGVLEDVAGIALPLALINLGGLIGGLRFSGQEMRPLLKVTAAVAVVRYVLFPAVFFALFFSVLRHLALPAVVVFVLFLEMHVPPATNLSLMTGQARVNEDHTAATLLGTYVLYLVVMPVYLALFLALTG